MSRIFAVIGNNNFDKEICINRLVRGWQTQADCRAEALDEAGITLAQAANKPVVGTFQHISCVIDGVVIDGNGTPVNKMPDVLAERIASADFETVIKSINGNFCIMAFDHKKHILWVARDRIGIRPCYYINNKDVFASASRPGVLLAVPGVSKKINNSYAALFASSHYRTFDNDRSSSPYADIKQLPGGHIIRVENNVPHIQCYWKLEAKPNFTAPEDELAEQYCELFQEVVKDNLELTDKVAFTLSGGLDSSSVMASSVKYLKQKQHAFSSIYDDPTFDESAEIASMLDTSVEQWHQTKLGQVDLFSIVGDMIKAHDEPVATATWLAHWLVCKDVADGGFSFLYGGLGGDELNAGEYEYFFPHFADLSHSDDKDELNTNIDYWAKYHDHPVWHKNRAVAEEKMKILTNLNNPGECKTDYQRLLRYEKTLNPDFFELKNFHLDNTTPFKSYLKTRTWQDLFVETAPCCLRAEDRQTQAYGLMNIDPFYDYRLVEFMFRIPGSMKIRNGVTKILLRKAMKNILPEETRTRIKKTGWNAPAHIWFTGKQADSLKDMIRSTDFCAKDIYNIDETERLINEHIDIIASGKNMENHMMFLWQLLNLELWLKDLRNIDAMDNKNLNIKYITRK